MTFTKEAELMAFIKGFLSDPAHDDKSSNSLTAEVFRVALAALESRADAEPVAWTDEQELRDAEKDGCGYLFTVKPITPNADPRRIIKLYTRPQPAPVVVPDDFDAWAKSVGLVYELYGLRAVNNATDIARKAWLASRAAMLQGADGTLTNEGTIPALQFKPVADLYGLTSPTGGETSFTFDAVEARDFIDGGWTCQEYVELERFQQAVSGNSPAIPDGWVACSERMPDSKPGSHEYLVYETLNHRVQHDYWNTPDNDYVEPLLSSWNHYGNHVTHWMPLPAAPQQEKE